MSDELNLETTAKTSIPVSEFHDPVTISEDDHPQMRQIQVQVDTLAKYRQEIGRITQVMGNLVATANDVERELAEARRALASKYNLEQLGTGQWAIDFERKQFVRLAEGSPVIP